MPRGETGKKTLCLGKVFFVISAREKDTALRVLEEFFRGDERALEAVRFLQKRTGADGEDDFSGKLRFPLPSEVAGREGAFALFSDGACRGNPGPGAWGAMGQDCRGRVLFQSNGVNFSTTNNRMELEGAIVALEELERCLEQDGQSSSQSVFLFSDSKYVVDGIMRWVPGWKRRGWKKTDKRTPLNLDLWKRLDCAVGRFSALEFRWVQGHSGHPQNEYVDRLANKALDESGNSLLG